MDWSVGIYQLQVCPEDLMERICKVLLIYPSLPSSIRLPGNRRRDGETDGEARESSGIT